VNQELSKIFREIAILLEIKEVPFKPQAYEKVASELEFLKEDVHDMYKRGGLKAIEDISGVGKGIAEKIEEYIKTSHIKDYIKLKKELPVDIEGLSDVEGVGPKTILTLYKKLGIKTRDQLEKAAREGKLEKLDGFGHKTENRILHAIEFLKKGSGRLIRGFNMPTFRSILEKIKKVDGVQKAEFAGSTRRMQETVGDLDILVISNRPTHVMDFFVSMPEVKAIHSKGATKSSVRLRIGIDADLRVLPIESYGAAQQYFTGDKYHNVKLREIAIDKGYKLNEYGLYKGNKVIASKTEKEIYSSLNLEWIPPELRTNHGEIEAAGEGKLPKLIGYDDVKGDLQIQTDWTDGEHSIEDMAKAAKERGLEYICITDHTKSLAMTGGSDEKKLLRQMAEIDKINKKIGGIKILKGAEVNIMKDGTLDIEDKVLAKLDCAGAAVHSLFKMSKEDMTNRIIRAMENPNIDIIFHPTGRLINKREPYEVDMEKLLKIAKKTNTVMEIDAFPDRLDLNDEYIRKAVSLGVKMSIDTDAHATQHLDYMEYGIAQARRGWAEKKDIINTKSWQELLKLLK
jgi:DNA polymerase (family X)